MTLTAAELEELALAPKKTKTDEGEVEERSMKDTIDGDRYLRSGQITGVPYGLKIARTKPPGTI